MCKREKERVNVSVRSFYSGRLIETKCKRSEIMTKLEKSRICHRLLKIGQKPKICVSLSLIFVDFLKFNFPIVLMRYENLKKILQTSKSNISKYSFKITIINAVALTTHA